MHRFSKEVYESGLPIVASSNFHNMLRVESWKTQTYLEDLNLKNIFHQIRTKNVEPVWL